ncbi:hypothetical protein Trydic_g1446 [Trypoxylus dichotomus]
MCNSSSVEKSFPEWNGKVMIKHGATAGVLHLRVSRIPESIVTTLRLRDISFKVSIRRRGRHQMSIIVTLTRWNMDKQTFGQGKWESLADKKEKIE